jgi:hypothetical protein
VAPQRFRSNTKIVVLRKKNVLPSASGGSLTIRNDQILGLLFDCGSKRCSRLRPGALLFDTLGFAPDVAPSHCLCQIGFSALRVVRDSVRHSVWPFVPCNATEPGGLTPPGRCQRRRRPCVCHARRKPACRGLCAEAAWWQDFDLVSSALWFHKPPGLAASERRRSQLCGCG